MTERHIGKLFAEYRCLKAELAIMQICSEEFIMRNQTDYHAKCAMLERKIAVIHQLSTILPFEEQFVMQKHLSEGLSWTSISEIIYNDRKSDLPYDKRSLQRVQARALERIYTFLHQRFQNDLDFLIEED